jgi:KaiC/GvpD/RAD55 family RecA-like ATPase
MFKKAERKKAKLRLALSGTSGSGKTYGALQIAKGIGGKVAVLDTERGSASLYADMMDFDVVELGPPYEPERFVEVMDAAAKAGYDVLVIDSITHEWKGAGGMLEIVDNIARAKFRGNSYAAWNEGDKRHRRFVDAMLHSPMHIIVTMRSKAVYVEGERNGKKTIQKQGAAPEQRDGIEYEFTAVLDLTVDGNLAVKSKDRTRLFGDPFVITEDTGRQLREWLESGVEVPEPTTLDKYNAIIKAAKDAKGQDFTPYATIEEIPTEIREWAASRVAA